MVQLVEITGVLNEKGCIEIPIVLLAQTGIRTGEEVNLIYLAAGEKDYRNESREFMLKRAEEDPLEELQSGETELKLPPQLLADAHIPLDADLDIVCLDRKIVILPTEDVESEDVPKELLDICADLGIPREKVNIVLRMTEEENGRLMEIMECEITPDGKRHFNSLFRYEITENRVEGDKFIINGTHKKVCGISESLKKRFLENGMPREVLNKITGGGASVC